MSFDLSTIIAQGSFYVATHAGNTGSFQFRLSNDARFFWTLIIPEQPNIVELHDMTSESAMELFSLARTCGAHLQNELGATKINSASIGNIVPQLHYHVVARFEDDAAWPGPVWGHKAAEPSSEALMMMRTDILKTFLATL